MGKPVRIADVARQIADLAPHPVEVVYTGLRPGEKLHEDLFGPGERDIRPLHPLISHVDVPALDPAEARVLDPYANPTALVSDLLKLCDPDTQPLTAAAQVSHLAVAETVHRPNGRRRTRRDLSGPLSGAR
jgi:FlaA1/EpsC-like NDP-sugar epimerase